ncbi:hypothetical protein AGR7C_Cc160133 [Agrobacterium deltaense Zutra 3/1]|uniref:HTH gntR-type domain-containing protein n=1 Tax=Agrobacterium deltaense Zutra 3/1 TaxID=1183427 RepID=A0A1S7PLB3_9HYPH|nr:hypothetical protein [Agrobacterium deltaense]CUX23150.1 hypothetical protein AGR7C_Cc160133 [Agrobacterium deltaense Zutra 3/1]
MGYSQGEKLALDAIIAEIRENRRCMLSHGQIAERAGVGKSTVRVAIIKAELRGDVVIQRRKVDGLYQFSSGHFVRLLIFRLQAGDLISWN